MAGTFSQLLLHIVFSTKRRTPWITDDVALHLREDHNNAAPEDILPLSWNKPGSRGTLCS